MTRIALKIPRLRLRAAAVGALCCAVLAGLAAAPAGARKTAAQAPPLLTSPLLWATVDVCAPPDQTGSFGIRGSMPGDGQSSESMYMRFRVQYRDPTSGQWTFLASNGDSGYVAAGSARYRFRQSGWVFKFVPPAAQPAYRLRGVVDFQWRRGTTLLLSTTLYTTAGHNSGTSADPPGYSSSTCTIS